MSKRVSFDLPGVEHTNPIPGGCRIGSFLMTSGVSGKDPRTGKFPEGIDAQCAQMFANVRTLLAEGGAAPEDVIKVNVWIKDKILRPHLNREWLAMFPDGHSRPARHTFASPDLDPPMLVQCEVIAVIAQ
ncbi:MAG: RidA family protein [Acidobacteriia bacterium]|nr:RidA family protein [Terriglobia bacterium]